MIGAPTILVLGGYGEAGRRVSRLLLAHTNAGLVISGRRLSRASAWCDELNREFVGLRARPRYGDASDAYTLTAALAGVDLVVVAATTAEHAPRVAEAAMAAGADYLDCHFDQRVWPALQKLDARARETNHSLITQAGVTPGLPGVLMRLLASGVGELECVRVGIAMGSRDLQPRSVEEVVRLARNPQESILKGGQWRRGGWTDSVVLDFGGAFGRARCTPLELVEVREAASLLGLVEAGFYMSGTNLPVHWFVYPLVMGLGRIGGRVGGKWLAGLLAWSVNAFSRTSGASVVAEGAGPAGRASISIESAHLYELAASGVVACVRQWIGGHLRRPGVLLAGLAADPAAFLDDLALFGVKVSRPSPSLPATGR